MIIANTLKVNSVSETNGNKAKYGPLVQRGATYSWVFVWIQISDGLDKATSKRQG